MENPEWLYLETSLNGKEITFVLTALCDNCSRLDYSLPAALPLAAALLSYEVCHSAPLFSVCTENCEHFCVLYCSHPGGASALVQGSAVASASATCLGSSAGMGRQGAAAPLAAKYRSAGHRAKETSVWLCRPPFHPRVSALAHSLAPSAGSWQQRSARCAWRPSSCSVARVLLNE